MRGYMIAGAISALAVAACGGGFQDDQAMYDELADSADAALVLGVFIAHLSYPEIASNQLGTPAQYAAVAADEAPVPFSPPGCATAVADGGVVTVTFDGCRGPGVIRDVRGALRATYLVADYCGDDCATPLVGVDFATTDLHANDLDFAISPTAITVHGPRSDGFDMGGHVESWSLGACTTLTDTIWTVDGTYTNANTNHYVSSFGLQRCAGGCPVGNVYRHMSGIAGRVGTTADPPIQYAGNAEVVFETLEGTVTVDARCD